MSKNRLFQDQPKIRLIVSVEVNAVEASMVGNTPTGVGKTTDASFYRQLIEKHPHGCGED